MNPQKFSASDASQIGEYPPPKKKHKLGQVICNQNTCLPAFGRHASDVGVTETRLVDSVTLSGLTPDVSRDHRHPVLENKHTHSQVCTNLASVTQAPCPSHPPGETMGLHIRPARATLPQIRVETLIGSQANYEI